MKWVRPVRLTGQVLLPRPRPARLPPCCVQSRGPIFRLQSTAASPSLSQSTSRGPSAVDSPEYLELAALPSPPASQASSSAKLSALHSRLSLPSKLPLTTLARTLIDATADETPLFNNASLASLGNDMLGYYCAEHLVAHYPRLHTTVLHAAIFAYIGPPALAAVTREWGVDAAADPGGEVDPGLLQFRPARFGETPTSSRSIYNAAQRLKSAESSEVSAQDQATLSKPVTSYEKASASFLRALVGALYLHTGRQSTKQFITSHILSRHLSLPSLFSFRQPTRDLSRLCAKEGFAAPIARLISETGRLSRHPVFVVGVYSGDDKLGEGQGASLAEARTRAAVSALMGWYLYTPEKVMVPSVTEEEGGLARWRPNMIDGGEVIV
ncbi:MAG: MCM DNA helicase complex subunit [Chaenotheca gracillima]|nr:MAG: MCM DNA helicase complex subunit [Chaenotheca gracillima]